MSSLPIAALTIFPAEHPVLVFSRHFELVPPCQQCSVKRSATLVCLRQSVGQRRHHSVNIPKPFSLPSFPRCRHPPWGFPVKVSLKQLHWSTIKDLRTKEDWDERVRTSPSSRSTLRAGLSNGDFLLTRAKFNPRENHGVIILFRSFYQLVFNPKKVPKFYHSYRSCPIMRPKGSKSFVILFLSLLFLPSNVFVDST